MATDMTYCVNPDCAYYKGCDRSVTSMPNRRGVYSFANLGGQCSRYAMQNEAKRMGAEREKKKWEKKRMG